MMEADLAKLGRDELVALVRKQAAALEQQAAALEQQADLIAALQAKLDELTRSGKRQAAPFSKETRAKSPKRPGRKPGQGLFKTREAPPPEQLSEPPSTPRSPSRAARTAAARWLSTMSRTPRSLTFPRSPSSATRCATRPTATPTTRAGARPVRRAG